jgi:hypothetical protein
LLVKVKLTIALASGGNLLVSRAFDPSRISGEGVAPGVEQIGRCAGRGGVFLRGPRAGRPTVTEREGFLRALPHCFLFLVFLWEAPVLGRFMGQQRWSKDCGCAKAARTPKS